MQRSGTHLTLGGSTFRYSGPNIEWLGLEGYGPHDAMGPRYPTRFEIDDAFATSAEMGARVVRAQTMGDTVGCALCIEPEEDKFNEAAFQASDYALLVARRHNMKIIVTLVGDCATCAGGGLGQYLAWEKKSTGFLHRLRADCRIREAHRQHVRLGRLVDGRTAAPPTPRTLGPIRRCRCLARTTG